MSNKTVFGSIAHRNDIAENWGKAINFIPKKGEIIIYNAEGDTPTKFKVGDGVRSVVDLPFVSTNENGIVVDDALSDTSANPVQNKVIYQKLSTKANSSSLSSKAEKTVVDGLVTDVETIQTDLADLKGSLDGKASQDDLDALTQDVNTKLSSEALSDALSDALPDALSEALSDALKLYLAVKVGDKAIYFKCLEVDATDVGTPLTIS